MQQIRAGFLIAFSTAQDMARLWGGFWRIITPWNYVYICLAFLHAYMYPQGNPNWLFWMIWQFIFFGIMLLMAWNWGNAVAGRAHRLDFQHGWEDPEWREYTINMMLVSLGVPAGIFFGAGIPLTLLFMMFGMTEQNHSAMGLMMAVLIGIMIVVMARLLPLSAAMIYRQVAPLPKVWQSTARNQGLVVTALLVLFMVQFAGGAVLWTLGNLLVDAGLSRADLILLVPVLGIFFFMLGWLVLLSQRVFALLNENGAYAKPRTGD